MVTLSAQMDLIVRKTAMLLQLCEALQEENDLLRLELESLSADSERARQREEINEKKLDTKQKIDDFVREIDRCIRLLKAG